MTDENRVDLVRSDPLQQPRHSRIAEVDDQPEPVILNEVAAACLSCRRPCAASAENGKSHRTTLSADLSHHPLSDGTPKRQDLVRATLTARLGAETMVLQP